MAYNAQTGKWEYEDDSVTPKLNGLLKSDNPLMQQARTRGAEQASSRGLLNSTLGVTAGESAAISAATPIALQESSQTATKNVTGQQGVQAMEQGAQQITGQKDIAAINAAAARELEATRQAAETARAGSAIASQERMQGVDINAQGNRLNTTIAGNKDVTNLNNTSAQTIAAGNNTTQLAATDRNNTTQLTGIDRNNANQLAVTDRNNANNVTTTGMNNATQQTVAGGQLSETNRTNVATAASNAASRRDNVITSITNNPNIPADERKSMIENATQNYHADINMINLLYGTKLTWPEAAAA